MLFLLEFHVLPGTMLAVCRSADPAELLELPEVGLLGLHDTEGPETRVAGLTVAGVDGSFSAWHSWRTLRGSTQ